MGFNKKIILIYNNNWLIIMVLVLFKLLINWIKIHFLIINSNKNNKLILYRINY